MSDVTNDRGPMMFLLGRGKRDNIKPFHEFPFMFVENRVDMVLLGIFVHRIRKGGQDEGVEE